MVGWALTALSTQFRLYCAFNVELYYNYKRKLKKTDKEDNDTRRNTKRNHLIKKPT